VIEGSPWQRGRWQPRQQRPQQPEPLLPVEPLLPCGGPAATLEASAAAAAVVAALAPSGGGLVAASSAAATARAAVPRPRGWTMEELQLALGRTPGQQQPGASSGGGGSGGSSQQQGGEYVARHALRLASAYAAAAGAEPAFTSFHSTSCHTLDYIWFTPQGSLPGAGQQQEAGRQQQQEEACRLQARAVLLPPDRHRLPSRGLPSNNWPSDHISLACDFVLEW
jgi:hypothetical protein